MERSHKDQSRKPSVSEGHLWNLLDAMIEGLQIIGFDWKYIYVNDALVKQSHYTKEQLLGHSVKDLYPGIEATAIYYALNDSMLNRVAKRFETEFEFPDKSRAWFQLSIQPVAEGISVLSVDITNRKRMEDALRASESEYRSLIEQATDGIFVSDTSGKYIDVNQSACNMLGYSKDELLTMSVSDVLTNKDFNENPPKFDLLQAGKSLLTTRKLRKKDGAIVSVEINSKMLPNGKMLGMVRDISVRLEAEQKLNAAEKKFKKLTETAFDAIVLMDEKGDIIFWNRGAEIIFGYRKEEVLQKPLTLIMPTAYRSRHENGLLAYLVTGEKHVMDKVVELEGQKNTGEIFPIEISITSWRDGDENIFSGIIRDITERKEATAKIEKLNLNLEHQVSERTAKLEETIRQLKESEEKFQKAFHASAASIAISKLPESRFVDVNETFTKITGYSREEVIGKTSLEIGMVQNIQARKDLLAQTTQQHSLHNFEITIRTKSGRLCEMLSSVEVIVVNGEQLALTIAYDITDRKRIQQKLEATNKELEAFTYSVSHDLRAPLRFIIGYSEALEEDFGSSMSEPALTLLKKIQNGGSRMNVLIDALLKLTKFGMAAVEKSRVDTEKIIESCITSLSTNYTTGLAVHVNPMPEVYADAQLLYQVWYNLISNAFKYSSKCERPAVEIGNTTKDGFIEFYIRDNGAGFNMEYASRLFGPFQRLHNVADFEGTGVGLSIVKRIIEKHGGNVWAESKPNAGATFFFTLPVEENE